MPERAVVIGCPIDVLDLHATVQRCDDAIRNGEASQHVAVNAAKLVAMESDRQLREIVHGCDIVSADGQAVVWASRLLGRALPERVAGIDLMEALFALAEANGYSVFILGARSSVLERAVDAIRSRYPGLAIAGRHHGYFDDDESEGICARIRASGADILFVAMSSPRKERWLAANLDRSGVKLAMGVGGAIDVVAGDVRRAPRVLQRCGLEWLFRLVQEPRRLLRRYAVTNARFVMLVAREFVRARLRNAASGAAGAS